MMHRNLQEHGELELNIWNHLCIILNIWYHSILYDTASEDEEEYNMVVKSVAGNTVVVNNIYPVVAMLLTSTATSLKAFSNVCK